MFQRQLCLYIYLPPSMAESEEELKSLLMKVKGESEKVDLKLMIATMKLKDAYSLEGKL